MVSRPAVVFIVGLLLFFLLSACWAEQKPIQSSPATPSPVVLTRYKSATATADLPASPEPARNSVTITPTPHLYQVAADELGSEIALRFGVSVAMLKAANPQVDLDFLKEGQELIIPEKSQTQIPLVYTPTPIELNIQNPHCYPDANGGAWCLVLIENNQPGSIYYMTGDFLLEADGQIRTENATALVDLLPAGKQIPLIAHFESPVSYPFRIDFRLNSAFTAENPAVIPAIVKDVSIQIDPSGLLANINGIIQLAGAEAQQAAVVAVAYQGNRPVGIRRIELVPGETQKQDWPFELTLYSIGVAMDRVELYAESR